MVEGGTSGKPAVEGLTGWRGQISRANLRPALRNPRDLDASGGGRQFVVPSRGLPSRYFAPGDRAREIGVVDYVAHGESSGIHQLTLVRDNASERHWYRQVRRLVDGDWVLPYNSAYDYFAADNKEAKAVLNGRFLGVDAKEGVDSDLLGAVLNSTFALLARLIVGVSTGSEGAYDVGPPAARLMRIPDPRKFTASGRDGVLDALTAIRTEDRLLPAPSSSGAVVPLRRKLDLAILSAMGESPGNAAVLLDRIYASYARWRASVEHVEDQVQVNRRALGRRGGTRGQDPVAVATQTVRDEIGSECDVAFGQAFADPESFELIDVVPPSADLQDALIPQTVVTLTATGELCDLGSQSRVEYARVLRELGWLNAIPIPLSDTLAASLATQIEKLRATVSAEAATRAATYVATEHVPTIVAGVVKAWRRVQCDAVRAALPKSSLTESHLSDETSGGDGTEKPGPSLFDAEQLVPKPPA